MIKNRHHRGGYQFAGRLDLVRPNPSPRPSPKGRGRKTINRLAIAFLLFILIIQPGSTSLTTMSQSNSPQSPVELSGERHHHPKFENEFVRIWDVTVPAGEATLW